jgi:phage terminase large subunit
VKGSYRKDPMIPKGRGRVTGAEGDPVGDVLLRMFDEALNRPVPGASSESRWLRDPVGFARQVLGVELWGFQVEVLLRVAGAARHTAIAGGRKIGKDFIGAVCAMWWYAVYADGRVQLYGPTMRQIDDIIWREIRRLWAGHGRCVDCKRDEPDGPRPCPHSLLLDGEIGTTAKTGLKPRDKADLRQIIGMTAVSSAGVVGFSGRILAIEDEASRMRDDIDEAIVGNLAAEGCCRLAIANPTRTIGFFADLFHRSRGLCGDGGLFQVSSESSPNVIEGREVMKGLASREWIAERERAWGRGSAPWLWHVEGKFLAKGVGHLFGSDDITSATMRWETNERGDCEGRLVLGLDVAGDGYDGDETAFAVRRGARCHEVDAKRGKGTQDIVEHAFGLVSKWRRAVDRGEQRPRIVVDRDGSVGARMYNELVAWNESTGEPVEVVGFRGSPRVKGQLGEQYHLRRDLMYAGLRQWLSDGGEIPPDSMLEGELAMMQWKSAESAGLGVTSLMPKSEMREVLDRSPDRCDALALSTWGHLDDEEIQPPTRAATEPAGVYEAEVLRPVVRRDIFASRMYRGH